MKYKRTNEIVDERIEGDMVILDYKRGKLLTLNETAARIWELLRKEIEEGEICDVLTKEFAVTNETASTDVRQLLEKLKKENLVIEIK